MSEDENDRRVDNDPQGPSERKDNELADVLAVAEEHEPDPEKSKYLRRMRAGPKPELSKAAARGTAARRDEQSASRASGCRRHPRPNV